MKKLVIITLLVFLLAGCNSSHDKDNSSSINSADSSEAPQVTQNTSSTDNTTVAVTKPKQTSTSKSTSDSDKIKVSIPEGYTFARIAETLETKGICKKADLLAIVNSSKFNDYSLVSQIGDTSKRPFRLEGYLSPATYDLTKGEGAESVLRKLVNQNEKVINSSIRAQAKNQGFTMDQIIILASMIEKESKTDSDRYNVSAVFRNRLKKGKQLQSCATIKYVEGAVKPYISGDVNRYNSLINTYKVAGLPSSPICSPGIKSIQAALNPTSGSTYLYFFSDINGKIYFSSTYEEHQQKMKQFGVVEAYNQT